MTDDAATTYPAPRRRRRGLSIQSKLLLMLLATSVLSTLIVGVIGYVGATDALRESALKQLTSIRDSRASEITRTMNDIKQAAVLSSGNKSASDASVAFNAAFEELQRSNLTQAQDSALENVYDDEFIPQLDKASDQTYSADSFLPRGNAARYLQSRYTAPTGLDYDKAIAVVDAGDGSAWSAAHAEYHPFFSSLVTRFKFEDALLLNTDGDVVYSAYKGVDLGTNLDTGPFRDGDLAKAYRDVLATNTADASETTDFQRYVPSLNAPTAWEVSPVGANGKVTGVLALQIPIDTINSVMTGDRGWAKQGLGDTGEVYLAGPDHTMRSISRELIQHPKQYAKQVISAGTPIDTAKRVVDSGNTVLLQPAATGSVGAALSGKTGTRTGASYLGGENLAAYRPLQIAGLDWVIVARIDTSEAYAPVALFTRNLVLSTAAIALLVSLLSLLLAQIFLAPIRRLQTAVRRVAAGEVGVQVDTRSHDEIAELGSAFNDMSHSLQTKADLLDAERAEYDRLLTSVMPETVAQRYRQGDETIAEDHQDVSVIFADILGFDEWSRSLPSQEALASLNDILRGFDDAAAKLGVERVRTTRQEGYLASCGLIVPRVDNARRMVDFSFEMQKLLERFNAQYDARLTLRAGIDSGTVTSGLIGRSSVVYDMWGDAVSLAHRVMGADAGVYLTQRVADQLPDTVVLVESGSLDTQTGEQRVWRIDAERSRA